MAAWSRSVAAATCSRDVRGRRPHPRRHRRNDGRARHQPSGRGPGDARRPGGVGRGRGHQSHRRVLRIRQRGPVDRGLLVRRGGWASQQRRREPADRACARAPEVGTRRASARHPAGGRDQRVHEQHAARGGIHADDRRVRPALPAGAVAAVPAVVVCRHPRRRVHAGRHEHERRGQWVDPRAQPRRRRAARGALHDVLADARRACRSPSLASATCSRPGVDCCRRGRPRSRQATRPASTRWRCASSPRRRSSGGASKRPACAT